MLGLMGFVPADLDPDAGEAALTETRATQWLKLGGETGIAFDEARTSSGWAMSACPSIPTA
jgi:L-serine dehydratase